jgi:predicted RNA binding protein YcfA (HicA-like mRNA interferase family)
MFKIPVLKPKEVIRALEKGGFYFARQKGSHKLYKKGKLRVTVPYHNKDLAPGTMRQIIEQSGLTVIEFLR